MSLEFVKQCKTCDARYKIRRLRSIARDKDQITCDCGTELLSWNGGYYYVAEPMETERK